jgi:endonuclease/exonuclease/phosphatase family metal-dependent hydrolase
VRLRVVVYNVRGFRDGSGRVAGVLRGLRPDIVLLNESAGRWRLRRLARTTGLRAAGDPWSPFGRRIKNAVLVRPPLRVDRRRLVRFGRSARFYPRGALVTRVAGPRPVAWAVCVHLGVHPAERLRHAHELLSALERLDGPVVLGGDLNERPEGRAARLLAGRYRDAWALAGASGGDTFPADEPAARIDVLLVSEAIVPRRAEVPETPNVRGASDHRPVVVDLDVPDLHVPDLHVPDP